MHIDPTGLLLFRCVLENADALFSHLPVCETFGCCSCIEVLGWFTQQVVKTALLVACMQLYKPLCRSVGLSILSIPCDGN